MNNILIYIFQVSLVFGSLFLVYKWLFSQFTFHNTNRVLLLLLLPISLLLPFSNALFPNIQPVAFQLPLIEDLTSFATFENFSEETFVSNNTTLDHGFWIFTIYIIGVCCFLARFAITNYKLIQLKGRSRKVRSNNTTLYAAAIPEVFSYFNWIFVPTTKIESIDELIITHEKAHVQKLHSLDVLLTELFITLFWFHPLAYWYRRALKSIHEFQADTFVLQHKVKKHRYLELLLTSLEPKNINPIYNYFSHPTLKKRIEMITKSPSKNNVKFRYILLIPAIAFLFMAFKNADKADIPTEIISINNYTNGVPSLFPVQNGNSKSISSKFGVVRKHPKLKNKTPHNGIDIKAKSGTPIIATADGVVTKAKAEGNWGNLIIISHADGFETWYAHLKGFNIKERATVKKGDIIGYVGNTGLSTAPHLHYEVHQHGKRLDPMKYIAE